MSIMETVTGRQVDFLDLQKTVDTGQINIEDIAWSLSRIARFTGHTVQLNPYSVAQHCIEVSKRARENFKQIYSLDSGHDYYVVALHGLLHDAAEAYTGDLNGVLKKLPEIQVPIKEMERKIDDAIHDALGIPGVINPQVNVVRLVKSADDYCQTVEAYNFMSSRGKNWPNSIELGIDELQDFIEPKTGREAYNDFIDEFNTLKEQLDCCVDYGIQKRLD